MRETRLQPGNFIYPLFVCPGERVRKENSSMPGVFNLSVDEAVKEAKEAKSLGLGGIILFGLPEKKDEVATGAWADDGIVQRATRAIKKEVRGLVVIGDVCLCEYMSHGHCGIVNEKTGRPDVDNDATLELLARQAVSHARAGVDMVAPSGMIDGPLPGTAGVPPALFLSTGFCYSLAACISGRDARGPRRPFDQPLQFYPHTRQPP